MLKQKYPKRGDVSRNVIVEYKRRPKLEVVPQSKEPEPAEETRSLKASLGERMAARK